MAPQLTTTRPEPGVLLVQLAGAWRLGEEIPATTPLEHELETERPERIELDTHELTAWDSTLVVFVRRTLEIAHSAGVTVERSGLPPGVQRLLALVEAAPAQAAPPKPRPSRLARIGNRAIAAWNVTQQTLAEIGELAYAFVNLLSKTARFRRSELWLLMQKTGAEALGIVGLVAGLVGLIIAFISAMQLQQFAATLYVASLVGIAMVRELGAVMAAIVVAGRTGAAYAAELGTMRVTQEIDALVTLGISPVEFLVLPRVLAVTLMLPLLCLYADLLGVIGGAIVGVGVMNIQPRLYYDQTIEAVSLSDLVGGVFKATTYGFLVGVAGCFIGLRSGRTAAAVGKAATSAVVAGIVLVIVACGVYAVVFYRLGL